MRLRAPLTEVVELSSPGDIFAACEESRPAHLKSALRPEPPTRGFTRSNYSGLSRSRSTRRRFSCVAPTVRTGSVPLKRRASNRTQGLLPNATSFGSARNGHYSYGRPPTLRLRVSAASRRPESSRTCRGFRPVTSLYEGLRGSLAGGANFATSCCKIAVGLISNLFRCQEKLFRRVV